MEEYEYDELDDLFVCPNCYANVAWNAAACPECGSDEETGWAEDPEGAAYQADEPAEERPSTPLWKKIVLIFLAYVLASPLSAFFEPSSTGFLLLTALLIIAITYIVAVEKLGGTIELPLSNRKHAISDYDSLMLRARHNEALVERLIAFEKEQSPEAGRDQWISVALQRWKRDSH
ncbi:MAG: hypothetical protein ACI9EW_001042 [Cellvibrionaceae bacterium]|jgi:hypothetical protein